MGAFFGIFLQIFCVNMSCTSKDSFTPTFMLNGRGESREPCLVPVLGEKDSVFHH